MKRVWIALGILLAIFVGTMAHGAYLSAFTGELTDLLTQAEESAEQDNWSQAKTLTDKAHEKWDGKDVYLHVLLRHSETDQVYSGFHEVEEFINCQEGGEYSAANARLMAEIELLSEAERLNLKNVL